MRVCKQKYCNLLKKILVLMIEFALMQAKITLASIQIQSNYMKI